MICPVCGNNSPDSLSECQFCSTPLRPAQSTPQQPAGNMPGNPQLQQNYGMQQPYNPQGGQYVMQTPYGHQQQYGTQQQYGYQPQYNAGTPVLSPTQAPADTAIQSEQTAPEMTEEEIAEEEKKNSKGTVVSLLVWFLIVAATLAIIHFDVPGMVTDFFSRTFAGASDDVSASD